MTDVSIVIPVKNGERYLEEVMVSVESQETDVTYDIVAVDSGSTDRTIEILRRHRVRLYSIAPDQFDHGLTRNLAIEKSDAPLIALLTQDATPADEHWLQSLVNALREPGVAGVYGRQVPRPDADPLTRRALEGWIAGIPGRRVHRLDAGEYERLSPYDRYLRCYFDNVCSAVRRDVWAQIPFPQACFAEDTEWGKRALLAGHSTVYEPRAAVIHSHDRTPLYEYRRTYIAHRRLYALFGLRTIPTRRNFLRAFLAESAHRARMLNGAGAGLQRVLASPAHAFASTFGQYRGAADECGGKPFPRWRV